MIKSFEAIYRKAKLNEAITSLENLDSSKIDEVLDCLTKVINQLMKAKSILPMSKLSDEIEEIGQNIQSLHMSITLEKKFKLK